MSKKFDVAFLSDALSFLEELDDKTRLKVIYNIDRASYTTDPKLFKKVTNDIWEFRTKFYKKQYRLLAFWDKSDSEETLVIATHGFVKKEDKIAKKEIKKAEALMKEYFL